MRCCVPNCNNDSRRVTKSQGIKFHVFPKKPLQHNAWLKALGKESLEPKNHSAVCSEHFSSEDLYETGNGMRNIQDGAVPLIQVCRVCLVLNVKLFPIRGCELEQEYKNLTGIHLNQHVGFPQQLCAECIQRLLNYRRFRHKSLRANLLLMDIIKKQGELTFNSIQSINRENNQLCSSLSTKHFQPDHYDAYILEIDETNQEINEDKLSIKEHNLYSPIIQEDKDEMFISDESSDINAATDINYVTNSENDSKTGDNKRTEDDFDQNSNMSDIYNDTTDNTLIMVTNLTMEEQIAKILKRQDSSNYKNSLFKCTECFKGFLDEDTYQSHMIKHTDNRIRDIKSISRTYNDLKSPLIQKNDENDNEHKVPPIAKVEVRDDSNELYYNENDDILDDDDDRALSEVCDVKKGRKIKKKKTKVKKIKNKAKKANNTPESTIDRYKKTDVKRRRTNEALDESLFNVCALTYEEQIQEVARRQDGAGYASAPYKCGVCYRGFHIQARYTAHAVRHSEKLGEFECFICKNRMKTSRALRQHLVVLHTEQYSCKKCPFITRNRGAAREHAKWHAGTKYKCPHCACEFDKLTTYKGHIRIKHVSDFVCELCGYSFVSQKGISLHKKRKHRLIDKSVTLEGPFCQTCNVKFLSEEAYGRHLKISSRHSSDHDPNRIRNDSQSIDAEKNGRVVTERRPVIHPRDPADLMNRSKPHTPVACEQCGIQLRNLRLYEQHFRREHPDKNRTIYSTATTPWMCEQCGKIVQTMSHLKDHMWVHTGEKRFKCDRCGKSFMQKVNLVLHMRRHVVKRPAYECPICGKRIAFYSNRRRHMLTHTGQKSFKCDVCGKCFASIGEQRAHFDHVHMKKPWPKRVRTRRDDLQHRNKCDKDKVEHHDSTTVSD